MNPSEIEGVQKCLLTIRKTPVMLDSDLARIYGVSTGALNQAVSRNKDRFPKDFCYVLTNKEFRALISQNVISKTGRGGRRNPPRVFTEHGALMASTVLRSEEAVRMSVYVIRAFVMMREEIASHREILKQLAEIDRTLMHHDTALIDIYEKLLPLLTPPDDPEKPQIGFDPKN